ELPHVRLELAGCAHEGLDAIRFLRRGIRDLRDPAPGTDAERELGRAVQKVTCTNDPTAGIRELDLLATAGETNLKLAARSGGATLSEDAIIGRDRRRNVEIRAHRLVDRERRLGLRPVASREREDLDRIRGERVLERDEERFFLLHRD